MTRRLSSSTRSHTEDSIFLRPDEDPVWLDEPTKSDKIGDGAPKKDGLPKCKDGPAGGQNPKEDEVFMHKVCALVIEIHCWAALFVVSQVTGYWVFFVVEGNGPFSSIYKALQVIDFYLGFFLPFHPIFGMDSMVLMREVVNTKQDNWIFHGTAGTGVAICVIMVIHMVCKWRYGTGLWSSRTVLQDIGDRRQSVSRQPSFTLSEWTDAQEDLLDMDPVPQTPVFEMGTDAKTEGDAATLTVTSVGLQERRGSNVSLTLDMCTPGCTEPYGYGAQLSPRDQTAKEYLRQGTHSLTPAMLHTRAMDDQSLQAEFYETPMNFVDPKEYNYPGLVRKNRYKTILPNTHSRVILKSQDEDDFLTTYINANYLKGYGDEDCAYIATQGPTVNTVGDFWRMVWQERSPIIVMITNLEEKNEKCAEYWPEDTVTHEGIKITLVTVTQEDDYSLRVFTLKCGGEERSLRQYWYTSWPDQKTPDKAPPLLELVQEVEMAREEAPPSSGPIIVHCSAGIGRTGCFIATSILCKQLRTEGVVDILRTTCQLRLDRGGMIQTSEQYQFVHHVLSLYEKQLSHTAEE
ncbi:tyrosine-protein phosphatase non-receptor type 5 [Sander lucioperca]|uniref:protein-tyrosine-phosphatase n=1 Tax=Sander lucioperca TaxID=283035 RepID=A0A8D0CN62_SANLU|nr:tyrosine-protein phosphatase non-receptor type 5 [Sander lucioperca]XP_031138591.1 tyrosine-protein phosphatase non-receptor type 5 [Sander lucioperca]XP_031138592.1 tyrosine-protein phosphatase non-receptor type 5 [Sander lucioperca]XP_031138593.1 tyrosine-protein phosphatase non-receptor type 5 [Sander lucioperca]XP_031138594.1 tyrosine-protein phosphatase non-receptor type 5 [Sander lucioperca]XP_035859231.1 tyrosine-protein phosphatase non-receptor type 5 [Sander lucioperca]XP_03585923